MTENENDFTQGSIVTKLLKFMIPIFGALVLQAMYGAISWWWAGLERPQEFQAYPQGAAL